MRTQAICSFFVLFAIAAVMVSSAPAAFADDSEVTIEPLANSWQLNACGGNTGVECFIPGTATVDLNGEVIFSNTASKSHTFTSGLVTDDEAGLVFNSGLVEAGESYSWTADAIGEHQYFCLVHPWEEGTIIVQEAKDEPMMDKDEPMMDKDEPMMDKDEPMMDKDEPMMDKDEPMMDKDEPMMDKDEPMMDKDEKVIDSGEENGGCLIATATYGSELAPQVQQLRELRDNTILSTESGSAFMSGFNQFYYSFSPAIADLERESPIFKEVMKASLTPMLASLSLLNHVDIDSEQEMLGYGISLIILNIGMYVGIPAFGILKLYQFRRN